MSRRADRELPGTQDESPQSTQHWRTPQPGVLRFLLHWLTLRLRCCALSDVVQLQFRWRRTLPIFVAIVTVCSLAIFNYQKLSSPAVASAMYALRTSPRAREVLGDQIYFKHQIPWIRGQMNQFGGRIDIRFSVRGSRASATMRFASSRPSARDLFETTEWSLTTDDGVWVDLLEGRADPFQPLAGGDGLAMEDDAPTGRGFRQQSTGAVR